MSVRIEITVNSTALYNSQISPCECSFSIFIIEGNGLDEIDLKIIREEDLIKKDMEIELDYISGIAFYTLKGHKFGKQMTAYHTEGRLPSKKRSFLKCLREIPMDKPAIHDIRLNFTFKHF